MIDDLKQPVEPQPQAGSSPASTRVDVAELAKFTNSYITDYIKFADAKAGAIVAGASAGVVIFGTLADAILSAPAVPVCVRGLSIVFMIVGGSALTAATILSLLSLVPRTSESKESLFSFPDIGKLETEDYCGKLCKLDSDSVVGHLSKQNHNLCKILTAKFKHQRHAVICLIGAAPILGALAFVRIFI